VASRRSARGNGVGSDRRPGGGLALEQAGHCGRFRCIVSERHAAAICAGRIGARQEPARARSGFVIAQGIWNLAQSAAEFRRAIRETSRVAAPDAALFVFTFSRNTFPPETQPVPGESFVFTQFSGEPQCFLAEEQLVSELGSVAFVPDPAVPLRELNRPAPGSLRGGCAPVIYEGVFRYRG